MCVAVNDICWSKVSPLGASGTIESTIQVPCGIKIKTKPVDLCQSVRGVLGNDWENFITQTSAMCNCLPQALDMMTNDLFYAVTHKGDISEGVSAVIADYMKLQKVSTCMD